MKDNNTSFIKGKTKEEMINNLQSIINLLSQKLEMDLRYINVEAIINERDKEQVKYLLVLFINILKMKELRKQHLKNVHFNNQINQSQRNCITEKEKKIKTESNLNKSFDLIIQKKKNNENTFQELLNNIKKNQYQLKYSKDQDNNLLYLPTSKSEEKIEENKIISINKAKTNLKYFLPINELIDAIIKLIKEILPPNNFYELLVNESFNKKISNIIKGIKILHLRIFKNSLISKQFLIDYSIEIKYIINKELHIYNGNKGYKESINKVDNIKTFSEKLKNIKAMKKYYILNYKKEKSEMKLNKLENDYQRKRSFITIYECCNYYPELIRVKKNKETEQLEFQELLFKLKYYQALKKKDSMINIMRKTNNKAKLLKNMIV